jgi:transposase
MMEGGMDGNRVIGIDIGKWTIEVAREGSARTERYANEAAAIAALVSELDPACDLVVFERTGGYERLLETALAAAGMRWAVVHSKRVKAFREAQGVKAKSDTIDCRLLRNFGRDRLNATTCGWAGSRTSRSPVWWRVSVSSTPCCMPSAVAHTIALLEAELGQIEAAVAAHIAEDPQLAVKERALCQRIGVAHTTARGLLALLPELGQATAKEITALGGIAPRVHQSGTTHKRRGLEHGRGCRQGHPVQSSPYCHAVRPRDQSLCPATASPRQARQGHHGGGNAQDVGLPQCRCARCPG